MTRPDDLSRRSFVKAAAAAAAAPYVITSTALGAGGHKPASERITVAGIAMGKQNNMHWGVFLGRRDTQVLACCDVETKRLAICKKRAEDHYARQSGKGTYKGCAVYGDFRELLARDDIDAVFMAPPDHWHAIIAIEACRQGKDIYCEKPLSLTIAEAKAMVAAARKYERVFQTGSMQRSDRKFRFGCEMARSGRIGKVHTVHANVGGPSVECFLPAEPVLKTLDWDMWLGPAPSRPFNKILCPDHTRSYPNWRAYRDYSGGGMTDWGAHHFDIAQWGLGMDGWGPVEIVPPDGKDVQRLTYKYANGSVLIHGGGRPPAGVEFIGPGGSIRCNRGRLETTPEDLMSKPTGPDEVHLYRTHGHQDDWINCIRTRRRPICDVAIGASSAIVCHLGNIAYWLKRTIRWDPAKQEIIGDDEAARWMDRPRREPWTL